MAQALPAQGAFPLVSVALLLIVVCLQRLTGCYGPVPYFLPPSSCKPPVVVGVGVQFSQVRFLLVSHIVGIGLGAWLKVGKIDTTINTQVCVCAAACFCVCSYGMSVSVVFYIYPRCNCQFLLQLCACTPCVLYIFLFLLVFVSFKKSVLG